MNALKNTPAIWLLLLLVGFPQLSETIYSPALPSISHALMTSNMLVQWTLSIYFIGFALGVFFWGTLSDRIGRKPAMILGLATYAIVSFLCLTAHNIEALLAFRLLQGFGASCGSVLTQAIARESLSTHRRHHFFSTAGFVLALAITLGPLVGGYLTEWFFWQANFFLLALIGLTLLSLAFFKLPETLVTKKRISGKLIRNVVKKMMFDKRILVSMWIVGAINGILFSYYAEGPFLFIRLIKLTPSEFGWLGIFIALAALLGTLASRRLIHRFSQQQIVNLGLATLLGSSTIFVLIALLTPISAASPVLSTVLIILPLMGIIFASFGFLIPITLGNALLDYKDVLGIAGALLGLGYYLLVSLFTWIMGLVHNGTVWSMPVYFFAISLTVAAAYFLAPLARVAPEKSA